MTRDPRAEVARFYDLDREPLNDVPFYVSRLSHENASVLDLGCGTGRVTLPLSRFCRFIHGIELSEAMLSICRAKLSEAAIPPHRAVVELGDITQLDLGRTFDLIIAPYRVLQNLVTDEDVAGLFHGIGTHLSAGATCILNVFNPRYPNREALVRAWSDPVEVLDWEVATGTEVVTCHHRKGKVDPENLVIYPDLIYRVRNGGELAETVVFNLAMRCYFPGEFERLITGHGFEIIGRWGGYGGEAYGTGPELVVQFRAAA
ncbi:MAG: class I SAM-dependent methyltransferase [Acidobacteriia bacterium]|nr:class I SAM-dependent methyltransferase [Terriglobia bacterium]